MAGERFLPASSAPPGAAGRVLPSPFQYYVDGADNLRIEAVNAEPGVTVSVIVRWWTERGEIVPQRFDLTPPPTRLVARQDCPLARGALMNITAFASAGTPPIGRTFVRVQLIRGLSGATLPIATLLQGYVTARQDLAYPGSPIRMSTEDAFPVRVITGTDPAPGVEIVETVPTGAVWELVSVTARLVTSAAGAPRFPMLQLDNGGSTFGLIQVSGTIGPSTFKFCCWHIGGTGYDALGGFVSFNGALPPGAVLRSGDTFRTNTGGLDVNDDWFAPVYAVREQLEVNT
jgi:hypothetical protein